MKKVANIVSNWILNTRSKLAWAASTLGVVTLGFSMFALLATAKGDEKFKKEVADQTLVLIYDRPSFLGGDSSPELLWEREWILIS